MTRTVRNFLLVITAALTLIACDGRLGMDRSDGTRKSATVYGYNYTDLYIDSFSVNGQGGSNLEVSTLTAGGSKHACCVGVDPEIKFPLPVTVRWTRDAYLKKWCELEVMLHPPISPNPEYFEVHFYPDGHVEVAVTEKASQPRLKMERFTYARRHETGNVNNDDKFARCTVEQ